MRNIFMPYITTILLVSLVILIAAPQTTLCSPTKTPLSELSLTAKKYVTGLRGRNENDDIRITLWMHEGDSKMNGCGFYFKVIGVSGKTSSAHFPNYTKHVCGNETYEMRMSSPTAMYDIPISFINDQISEIEVHADGYQDTIVDVVCIGLKTQIITGRGYGGPSGFCVNNDLLKSCKNLRKTWDKIDIDHHDITLTRTNRGTHKIVFREIENLMSGFDSIYRDNKSKDALQKVCERIELVRGTFNHEHVDCPAERTWTTPYGSGVTYHSENKDTNPYGCDS